MLELGLARDVALELHPIESLHKTLLVGLNETVELTIRNSVQYPSVGPNVLNRFRQLDPDARIALGNNLIDDHPSFGSTWPRDENGAQEWRDEKLHTTPLETKLFTYSGASTLG